MTVSSRISSFLILAILIGMIVSCNRNSAINRQLNEVELLINSSPDSAKHLLEAIYSNDISHMNESQKAELSILLAKLKLRLGNSFITEENFDQGMKYLESVSDTLRLVDMYQLAAVKKRWLLQQDSAAYFYLMAINLVPDTLSRIKSELYTKLSNLYAYPTLNKDYPRAIKYSKLALSLAETSSDSARALHDIGLFYSFNNHNDSAMIYMDEALSITKLDDPESDTYALNYANLPNAELQKSVSYLNRIKGKHLGKLITLGFLYLNNSRIDSATHYLNESKRIYLMNPSHYSVNTFNNLRILEGSLSLLKTGVVYPDDGAVTNDSISRVLSIQDMLSNEQHDYNNQLQVRLLESNAKRQLAWIVSLGVLLVLTVSFGIYIWNSKRKYLLLKRQLDDIKIEQIMTEAEDNLTEDTTSRMLILKRLEICIGQFRSLKLQSEIDEMELRYRQTGNFPPVKQRDSFKNSLISCFADFILDLKMTGVKLNMEDIITCIMTCLKESNMAIAACLGVTDTAIRTRKTRLRAKLPEEMVKILEL